MNKKIKKRSKTPCPPPYHGDTTPEKQKEKFPLTRGLGGLTIRTYKIKNKQKQQKRRDEALPRLKKQKIKQKHSPSFTQM